MAIAVEDTPAAVNFLLSVHLDRINRGWHIGSVTWLAIVAAAAQLSAPVARNAHSWVAPNDVPVQLLKANRPYAVVYRAVVEPSGKLRECQIERSSGDPKVDSYSCALVSKRMRFSPALDSAGIPTLGVYRALVSWWTGDGSPPEIPFSDIELSVDKLPDRVRPPAKVPVDFIVEPDGRVSSCQKSAGAPDRADNLVLVRIACEQITKSFKARPVEDSSGKFVSSIQTAVVRFSKRRH